MFTAELIAGLTFCVLAEIGRELGFKLAAAAASNKQHFALAIMASPILWLACLIGGAEFFAWFIVLRQAPLGLAYPVISLAYVGVPLAGVLLLHERMSARQWAGAVVIALGVACVSITAS